MKETSVDIGKTYALRSLTGGEVQNANGDVIKTLDAGKQQHETAQESVWLVPDDCQVTKANFKCAALALGLLGGGETSGLPAGYKRLEYLESNGSQRIKTRTLKANESVELRCTFMSYADIGWEGVFSYSTGGFKSEPDKLGVIIYLGNVGFYDGIAKYPLKNGGFAPSGSGIGANGISVKNKEVTVAVNWQGSNKIVFYIEGETVEAAMQNIVYSEDRFLTLFAINEAYNANSGVLSGRLYNFSASYEDGKEKLVPALDPTGAPCMYDLVSKQPFYNSGTGDFLYPGKEQSATTYSLRRPRMYAQMTPHGIRRLYHVPRGYNGTPEEYAEQNGFKILVETPQPEEGYWAPVWHEREDCIELEWVETEPPAKDELLTAE